VTDENYIPDLSSFNGRFKDARRSEGFSSPGALAAKLKLPESTVRRWEKPGGTQKPRAATIAPAAKVLRHQVDWLLDGTGDRYVEGAGPPTEQPADAPIEKSRPTIVEECEARLDQAIDSVEHALRTLQYARNQLRKR
jgi:transcriptional regulator with XRE-family HTH domain